MDRMKAGSLFGLPDYWPLWTVLDTLPAPQPVSPSDRPAYADACRFCEAANDLKAVTDALALYGSKHPNPRRPNPHELGIFVRKTLGWPIQRPHPDSIAELYCLLAGRFPQHDKPVKVAM